MQCAQPSLLPLLLLPLLACLTLCLDSAMVLCGCFSFYALGRFHHRSLGRLGLLSLRLRRGRRPLRLALTAHHLARTRKHLVGDGERDELMAVVLLLAPTARWQRAADGRARHMVELLEGEVDACTRRGACESRLLVCKAQWLSARRPPGEGMRPCSELPEPNVNACTLSSAEDLCAFEGSVAQLSICVRCKTCVVCV